MKLFLQELIADICSCLHQQDTGQLTDANIEGVGSLDKVGKLEPDGHVADGPPVERPDSRRVKIVLGFWSVFPGAKMQSVNFCIKTEKILICTYSDIIMWKKKIFFTTFMI